MAPPATIVIEAERVGGHVSRNSLLIAGGLLVAKNDPRNDMISVNLQFRLSKSAEFYKKNDQRILRGFVRNFI